MRTEHRLSAYTGSLENGERNVLVLVNESKDHFIIF